MKQSPEAIGPGQEFCKSAYAWIVRRRFYLIIIGSFSLPLFLETESDDYQNPNPTTTVMSNGEDCRYEIAQNAYIKLVLHALKHKTSAVNGVLLGRLSGDVVEIAESVPLFHSSQIGLLPPLEISLIMIEEYYSSQGLRIVGYFHANERFDDIELGTVATNIADHVHHYFPQAAVLLLDNKKLGALQNKKDAAPVMQLYTRDSSRSWKQVESNRANRLTTKEPSANIVLLDFTSSEKWNDIVDFDDHLDDISKDWLNSGLFK